MNFKPTPLHAVAAHVGGEVVGDGQVEIRGAASLEEAGAGDLSFADGPRQAPRIAASGAAAVIVNMGVEAAGGAALVRVAQPRLAFARALDWLIEPGDTPAGAHPGAHVDTTAAMEKGAAVMAGAYLGPGAHLGAGSVLYPGAVVLAGARVGAACRLYPGVVIGEGCRLGDRVAIHANAAIGGDGFGYVQDGPTHVKIPQIGTVEIGDDVEIGAGTTIDRAALGATVIGRGTKIDNLVMIGHGCRIGEGCIIVAQSGLAGSAVLEDGVIMGARAGVLGHLTIGTGSVLYSRAHVTKSLPPGSHVSGNPARPHKEALRQDAHFNRVDKLLKRVAALEEEVARLKGEGKN